MKTVKEHCLANQRKDKKFCHDGLSSLQEDGLSLDDRDVMNSSLTNEYPEVVPYRLCISSDTNFSHFEHQMIV